jgi:hypothetical protein
VDEIWIGRFEWKFSAQILNGNFERERRERFCVKSLPMRHAESPIPDSPKRTSPSRSARKSMSTETAGKTPLQNTLVLASTDPFVLYVQV